MPTVTPTIVTGLWSHMCQHYGTTVVSKLDSPLMRTAGVILRMPDFVTGFTTTIGRRIYVPFTVGVPGDWSLFGQLAVAVHEHQHVEQLDRDGLRFMTSYLLTSKARMLYEVEAYRSTLEMQWWYHGEMEPTSHIVDLLRSYRCSAADLAEAQRMLDADAEEIRQGVVRNRATEVAIGWLSSQTGGVA